MVRTPVFAVAMDFGAPLPVPTLPGRHIQRAEEAADGAAVRTLLFLRSATASVGCVATQAHAHTGWFDLKMAV